MNDFDITIINIIFWVSLHFLTAYLITSIPFVIQEKIFNSDIRFFKVSENEIKFYKRIKINKWKDKLPQYNKDFDKRHLKRNIDKEYLEEFIFNTCRAEVIHYFIGILGYLSMFFVFFSSSPKKYVPLYLIIATLMLFFNLPFSLIQRYNRYRLVNLLNRLKQRKNKRENFT